MKKFDVSAKIIIPILFFLFLITLAYDLFKYYSEINIQIVDYLAEILMIIFLYLYYKLLTTEFNFQNKTIQENVKLFVYLLGTLYLFVIITKIILNPAFSPGSFPPLPDTLSSVIHSNINSLLGIIFITPLLLILKNLIQITFCSHLMGKSRVSM